VPITPDEAVLSPQLSYPGWNGQMNIPAGMRSGQSLRLRGGWPQLKAGATSWLDCDATEELSPSGREYYDIRASRSFNPRSHLQQIRL